MTGGVTTLSGFLGNTNSDATTDPVNIGGFDFSGTTLAPIGTAIAAFDFDNTAGGSPILDFRQVNTDLDGSRARFYGVVVDGVVPIPEPSSLALLGLGLAGWYLTDNASDLTKWNIPSEPQAILAPGEYLVIFASGDGIADPSGNFHANFSLSSSGEYLALIRPDLSVASEFGARNRCHLDRQRS